MSLDPDEFAGLPPPTGEDCPEHPTWPLVRKSAGPWCRRGRHYVGVALPPAEEPREEGPVEAHHPWPADRIGGSDPDTCPKCGKTNYARKLELRGGQWVRPSPAKLTCGRCDTTWVPPPIVEPPSLRQVVKRSDDER